MRRVASRSRMNATTHPGGPDLIRPAPPMEGKAPHAFEGFRLCGAEECETRLSVYNPGPHCYLHTIPKKPIIRGKTTT